MSSNAQYIFSGSSSHRPIINLGGIARHSSDGNSQADLIQRAKREREERELGRLKQKASIKIQAFYRGRQSASETRAINRNRFDAILLSAPTTPAQHESAALVEATRLLAISFLDGNVGDLKRLGGWCRLILSPSRSSEIISKAPLLFSMLLTDLSTNWSILIKRISFILLEQAALHPSISQGPLFLEIVKMLVDPNSYSKWKIIQSPRVLDYLINRGYYKLLRELFLSIPFDRRSHPTLPIAVTLSLLPLRAFPETPTPTPIKSTTIIPVSTERAKSINDFLLQILTIPLLPHRVPLASLSLLAGMPLESIFSLAASPNFVNQIERMTTDDAVQLSANLAAFASKKINHFTNSRGVKEYLEVMQMLLDIIPIELLREKVVETDLKGKAKEIIIIDSDDEDEEENGVTLVTGKDKDGDSKMDLSTTKLPTATTIDPRTISFLAYLPSREHLVSLLNLSSRYSATTRPALAAFLVSLLASWSRKREEVLNTVMFGITSSSDSGTVGERGGGLLREIWRGYIRSSRLGKLLLATNVDRSSSSLLPILLDPSLRTEWPCFILLAELYSRCLLTLGDDEFYSAKNPLTLDEVVGFSAILRNLAFALYWQEGGSTAKNDMNNREGWEGLKVIGTRIKVIELRTLAVTLLNQIHARDSRKSFCDSDHWLMTSQFDLASFIQTVVYEDENEQEEEEEMNEVIEPNRPVPPIVKQKISSRQLSFIGPRQGVLSNIPFVIPFESRVAIFRQTIINDRQRLGIERHIYDRARRHRAVVRRQHLSEDSFAHLNGLGAGLKSTIEIVFVDENGVEEAGIDGGGLFKELLTGLSKEAFDTDRGLWLATKDQEIYPNPHSYARESTQLSWYSFIGRILGKALYEGILIDVRFADFFLAKWLGKQSYLDDLASLDPELYNGLMFLKNYTGDVETDLSLNFTVTEEDFGVAKTIDLVANGSEIPVTNENRISYIYLTSNYRLSKQLENQCAAFFAGLSEIIQPRSLRMFNQKELRMLVGGVDQPIDLADLRLNTVYGGFPGDEVNPTIMSFWSVVESFNKAERNQLIKFVTACERPPLLGFSELVPRFAVRSAGDDEGRLPTSSTCVNLLKLPKYSSKQVLREKLLYAISAQAGFDLS